MPVSVFLHRLVRTSTLFIMKTGRTDEVFYVHIENTGNVTSYTQMVSLIKSNETEQDEYQSRNTNYHGFASPGFDGLGMRFYRWPSSHPLGAPRITMAVPGTP